jgi:hypothetical protein
MMQRREKELSEDPALPVPDTMRKTASFVSVTGRVSEAVKHGRL